MCGPLLILCVTQNIPLTPTLNVLTKQLKHKYNLQDLSAKITRL